MSSLHASQELIDLLKKELLNSMYPINSIYITANPANPSTIFGGTWKRLSGGFLFGAEDSSYVRGDTGNIGSGVSTNNTTLTINQIPTHNHSGSTGSAGSHNHSLHLTTGSGSNASYFRVSGSGNVDWGPQTWVGGYSNWAGDHTHSFTTSNRGGGEGHNHPVPYIALIIWQRTA